jgi:excisionase family DNA binding protein
MDPLLIGIGEVAEVLSVHPNSVRKMCAQGILPARKFGRCWKIHRERFLKWVDQAYKR